MIEIINNVQNGIVELKFGDLGPSLFLVEKVSRRGRGGRTLGIKSAVAVIQRQTHSGLISYLSCQFRFVSGYQNRHLGDLTYMRV